MSQIIAASLDESHASLIAFRPHPINVEMTSHCRRQLSQSLTHVNTTKHSINRFVVTSGNLLVIITVLVVFSKPIDVTNLFIASLACADFLVATFTSPFQVRLLALTIHNMVNVGVRVPYMYTTYTRALHLLKPASLPDVPHLVSQLLAVPRLCLSLLLLQLLHILHVLRVFAGFDEPRKVR